MRQRLIISDVLSDAVAEIQRAIAFQLFVKRSPFIMLKNLQSF